MTSSKPQGLAPWPPSSTSNREASSASARQETPGFGGLVQWLDTPQGSVKGAGSLLGQTEHVCGAGSAGGACSAPDRPRRAGLQRRWLSRIPEPQARACLPDSRLALTAWKKQKEPLVSSGHVPVTAPPPHTHTHSCMSCFKAIARGGEALGSRRGSLGSNLSAAAYRLSDRGERAGFCVPPGPRP